MQIKKCAKRGGYETKKLVIFGVNRYGGRYIGKKAQRCMDEATFKGVNWAPNANPCQGFKRLGGMIEEIIPFSTYVANIKNYNWRSPGRVQVLLP